MTPVDRLARCAGPITDALYRGMHHQIFMELCDTRGGWWTLFEAEAPQDLQTDLTMHHVMGAFAWEIAGESGLTMRNCFHLPLGARQKVRNGSRKET
jgi:hypothetical protein